MLSIKNLIALACLVVVLIVAGQSMYEGTRNATLPVSEVPLSASDQSWFQQRKARPSPPGPKAHQPEVLLLWRGRLDVHRVRPLVPLVDYPQGLDGVYGMDVTSTDHLAGPLQYGQLMTGQSISAAWLVVVDGQGRQLGSTPELTPKTIALAFRMARGEKVFFPGEVGAPVGPPSTDRSGVSKQR
jgi:hypothetical protein